MTAGQIAAAILEKEGIEASKEGVQASSSASRITRAKAWRSLARRGQRGAAWPGGTCQACQSSIPARLHSIMKGGSDFFFFVVGAGHKFLSQLLSPRGHPTSQNLLAGWREE